MTFLRLSIVLMKIFLLCRDVERETSSSSTGQRFTHPTGGPAYFDGSSSSKSSSDSQPVDPMQLGGHLLSFNENQVGRSPHKFSDTQSHHFFSFSAVFNLKPSTNTLSHHQNCSPKQSEASGSGASRKSHTEALEQLGMDPKDVDRLRVALETAGIFILLSTLRSE